MSKLRLMICESEGTCRHVLEGEWGTTGCPMTQSHGELFPLRAELAHGSLFMYRRPVYRVFQYLETCWLTSPCSPPCSACRPLSGVDVSESISAADTLLLILVTGAFAELAARVESCSRPAGTGTIILV
uniref:(California timema) hypothetical protein n=1 Tax=Timema californicum TaxID=61474 RepID=A0A7R9JEQ4_TIMCA|nr:unnamed protein product [Timema californicum]